MMVWAWRWATSRESVLLAISGRWDRRQPRSTARTTMALPLRSGDRYRQATLDGLERLATVLAGGEDPGEPVEETVTAPARTIPTQEETAKSNAFTWIVALLAVGTIVPMLTWWIFSR